MYYYRPVGHLVQEPTQSLIPHPSQYLCHWKNKLRLFPADRASFEVYGVDRYVMWMAIQLGFSHWGSGALNRMGLVWFKDWSVNSHFRDMAPWFLSMTKHLRNLVSLPFSFPACDFLRAKGLLKADVSIADQILSFWDNWALKTLSCSWLPVYERCMSTATRCIIYPKLYSELAPCPEWPRDWEPGLFHGALHTWTSGASVPPKDII